MGTVVEHYRDTSRRTSVDTTHSHAGTALPPAYYSAPLPPIYEPPRPAPRFITATAPGTHTNHASYSAPSRGLKTSFVHSIATAIPSHPSVRAYKKGMTPLHWAVYTDDLTAVKSILASPPVAASTTPTNARRSSITTTSIVDSTADKRTKFRALHVAALFDRPAIAQSLITAGATVNITDKSGWTPLHYAALAGSVATMEILLSSGANMAATSNGMKSTPLHWAAEHGHEDVARVLVARGAQVDACDGWEWTPLHCACQKGHVGVVRLLVEKGADMGRRTKQKSTAREIARHFANEACVEAMGIE